MKQRGFEFVSRAVRIDHSKDHGDVPGVVSDVLLRHERMHMPPLGLVAQYREKRTFLLERNVRVVANGGKSCGREVVEACHLASRDRLLSPLKRHLAANRASEKP